MSKVIRSSRSTTEEGGHLSRQLGFWHLTGIALGGVIGSGWLLAPMKAARADGPAAVVAWMVGAAALIMISVVLVELGASLPRSGGLVRWPFHISGQVVGTFAGWSVGLAYAVNPPSEAYAALDYLQRYLPVMDHHAHLNVLGHILGLLIICVFVLLNWFSVLLFARFNLALTIAKVAVPLITAGLLFYSGFHSGNFSGENGVPHHNYTAVLPTVVTTGIFFAYSGFQGPLDVAGEARNAKRDVPRAVVAALLISTFMYVVLQVAVLGAEPNLHGWQGIDRNSTLVHLADMLNLGLLSILLTVSAGFSTSGSAGVYTTEASRAIYAMSKNGLVPGLFAQARAGSPRPALLLNGVLGAIFLFLLDSWTSMVTVVGILTLFGYSLSLIAEQALRRSGLVPMAGWVRYTGLLAPGSFVASTLLIYWASWNHLSSWPNARKAGLALVAMLVVVAVPFLRSGSRSMRELLRGSWTVGYIIALGTLALFGSTGRVPWIPTPWDSVLAGLVGLVGYQAGLRSAGAHLRDTPGALQGLLAD